MQFNFKNDCVQLSLQVDCDCCQQGHPGGNDSTPIEAVNAANPYDEIGVAHNAILAEVLPKWEGRSVDPDVLLDDIIAAAYAYPFQNARIAKSLVEEKANIKAVLTQAGLNKYVHFLMDPIQDEIIAFSQRLRQSNAPLEPLMKSLVEFEQGKLAPQGFADAVRLFEQGAMGASMSRTDNLTMLAAASVARHSTAFSAKKAATPAAIPGPVKSDIAGAIGGAITAGLPGAVIGGTLRSAFCWLFS